MTPTGRAVLAAALIAAMPSSLPAAPEASEAASQSEPETYVVRIGYTTFKSPEAVRGDSTLQSIESYLDQIAASSRQAPWKRPLQFELALGNYYQIWSWFKTGQIDAAVASPFTAMLLERDSQALSVLEFSEGKREDAAAHFPVVAATGPWRDKPVDGLKRYLELLLKAVRKEEPESEAVREKIKKIRKEFRLDLVSHLSTSGFIMPALQVQEWLDSGEDLDKATRNRFWRLFFENAHLTLVHGDEPAAPQPISTIRFSYSHEGLEREETFGDWKPYQAGRLLPATAPSIPNDVLLVRRQIAEELVGTGAADRARLGEVFMSPEIQKSFRDRNGKYTEVRWFNPAVHGRFREEVSQLFSKEVEDAELARLNTRWFERGLFDFTIKETMAFLRQDQKNSGIKRLGVVLSGGGVKSLYQTVLLDHLYGSGPDLDSVLDSTRQLRNIDEASPRSVEPAASNSYEALTVHTIIGTSGGAMLAFFAAQIPQIKSLQPIVESTSGKRLFPRADLPRLLSILVLLVILQIVLLTAKTFNWWNYGVSSSDPIQKSGTRSVSAIALLLVLTGAAAIVTTRSEYVETVPLTEVMFFILTCAAAHFGVTCIARAEGPPSPRQAALGRLALLGLAFGLQLVVISVTVRHWLGPSPEELYKANLPGLSALAGAGVFVIAAALLTGAAAGRWGLAVRRVRSYAAALTAAAVVTSVAFLPLIALALDGRATMLELTGLYWGGLLAAAVAASIGLLYLARAPRTRLLSFLRDGFVELMRDRRGVTTTSMTATIVGLFAFCIACWGLLVAPAVYSNVEAVRAFSESLPEEQLWTGRFRTNLVVTGTLLRAAHCSPTHTVNEGGLYFCFEGKEGCGTPGGGQWQVFRRPAPARALDAVFASGSAFPVFPPHLAHLPNGCEVRLVDGGYAHNVPLEAASMAEARQVLILNASPDPLDAVEQPQPRWRRVLRQAQLEGGQLVRSSPDVLSFLFARAQELDRSIGGDLVVASLTPRPENGWWPFLLDFRPSVRKEMIDAAARDIAQERRIGHVLSWGRPVLLP